MQAQIYDIRVCIYIFTAKFKAKWRLLASEAQPIVAAGGGKPKSQEKHTHRTKRESKLIDQWLLASRCVVLAASQIVKRMATGRMRNGF